MQTGVESTVRADGGGFGRAGAPLGAAVRRNPPLPVPMKLLVFAHTPPPHHGQSYMVQLMLEGFRRAESAGQAPGIQCVHVNARLSGDLGDVGSMRLGKLLTLGRYIFQAWRARWRDGVEAFYYVPSPPKRSALYRDWVVMLLCRPLFGRLIFHWHAVGLGEWLERQARPWERRISHWLLDGADLAIVLSDFNRADAARFRPRRMVTVANGIPDPCPDFELGLAPRRRARAAERRALLAAGSAPTEAAATVQVLFLAHCTRDKGLFDTVEGLRQANARLRERGVPLRLVLTVAGRFLDPAEERDFEPLRRVGEAEGWLRMAGFLSGQDKARAFAEADLFCFPTYFANEGQPVNLLEAMAHGLPLVTTRWRSIPELIPPGYPGLIEPRRPDQVAEALLAVLGRDGLEFRRQFLDRFTLERHLENLALALRSIEVSEAETSATPSR